MKRILFIALSALAIAAFGDTAQTDAMKSSKVIVVDGVPSLEVAYVSGYISTNALTKCSSEEKAFVIGLRRKDVEGDLYKLYVGLARRYYKAVPPQNERLCAIQLLTKEGRLYYTVSKREYIETLK